MPLTKRQKRRLLEISKMIESSIVVKDDMEEIQLEYAAEIDEVIGMVCSDKKKAEKASDIATDLSVYDESTPSNSQENNSSTYEHQNDSNFEVPETPNVPDAPDWAKKLWKAIAKKCHPDRLSFQELTAIQIARRQIWFLEARSLFEKRSWPRLIHIGVQVGEYVEDLSHTEQINWLSNEYNQVSTNIEKIQSSIAWQWGTNWTNLQLRAKILTVVMQNKGIQVPEHMDLIKALMNFESE